MSKLTELLQQKSLKIAVAESCTGGNLSALLTSQSGASNYFERGFITYSNQAKIELLEVGQTTLDTFGAVSEQTALEMARGVISHSAANVSIAITGIAGPLGGSVKKPVGTVCFGFCILGKCFAATEHFIGNRKTVIANSVDFAIATLEKQFGIPLEATNSTFFT